MDRVGRFRQRLHDNVQTSSSSNEDEALRAIELQLSAEGGQLVSLKQVKRALQQYSQSNFTDNDKIYGLALSSVYGHALNQLIRQTLPISKDILYWDSVIESRALTVLYGVQSLPQWAVGLNFRQLAVPKRLSQVPKLSQVLYLVNAPLDKVAKRAKYAKQQLVEQRDETAERLGMLVSKSLDPDSDLGQAVKDTVDVLTQVMGVATTSSSSSHGDQLIQVIDQFDQIALTAQKEVKQHRKPHWVVRYWPLLAVGGVVGLNVLGNWRAIVEWVKTSVWDTCVALFKNWIIDPMYQIYQTIRHDDSAQIALMTKQSLQADMSSLERMVVDFAKDTGSSADAEAVREAVSQGDLSAVLEPYERQLQSPITNLVKGGLVRSLLIQVQKTKVDVEVAMDGIDKLLQSQQLVFGIVAATPAIAIVWYFMGYVQTVLRGESRYKAGIQETKDQACECLRHVRDIVQDNGDTMSFKQVGLVMCQTEMLRDLGNEFLTTKRRDQWVADLAQLERPQTVDKLKAGVERIWLIYGGVLN